MSARMRGSHPQADLGEAMKNLFVLALLATGIQAPDVLAQSSDCTPIESVPSTISQSGKYCLVQDFVINSASVKAITLAANDITVDCQGHTIRNNATSATGSSEGIYAYGRSNLTVRNCRIQGGFTNGISLIQDNAKGNTSHYNTIENNFVGGPYWHGIRAYGSALEVKNNRIYDVGGQSNTYAMGLRLGGSTLTGAFRLHLVHENVIVGTNSPFSNAFGIYSDGSLASLIRMNMITGTTATNQSYRSYGVRLVAGTVNTINDNHIVGSPYANDIGIQTPTGNTCHDNTLRSATDTVGCDASLGNY
jgi:nitrous oxidase accessory protein NosD